MYPTDNYRQPSPEYVEAREAYLQARRNLRNAPTGTMEAVKAARELDAAKKQFWAVGASEADILKILHEVNVKGAN